MVVELISKSPAIPGPPGPPGPSVMAELVIGLTALLLGEGLVGLRGFLKRFFGFGISGVAVGVVALRQGAIGFLDLLG